MQEKHREKKVNSNIDNQRNRLELALKLFQQNQWRMAIFLQFKRTQELNVGFYHFYTERGFKVDSYTDVSVLLKIGQYEVLEYI